MIGRWYAALGVNLLLGVPAIVPIYLLYYIAATWVHPAPEENDGFGVVLIGFGLPVALCGFLWWAANRPIARRTRLRPARYWTLSLLGTAVPTLTLIGVSL
ncbi:hypothetical protein ACFU99_13015 [Streptomyces sp. NPDC057654]|uniref:hypothetical protein n=1 Tax=Streptomyces sp. NPDC057654 TaxID=3346196 RepID=UPI0036A7375A